MVAHYGSSSPKLKWFKAYCEFVPVATGALADSELNWLSVISIG